MSLVRSSGFAQALRLRDLGGDHVPPLSVWDLEGQAPKAIVLVGHGGAQHRGGPFVQAMAAAILGRLPAYVAAIDGPVHGDRCRGDPARVREAFIDLWLSPGGGADEIVADWRQALRAVRELDQAADLPVAYYGVSMGAAYGVALLAAEPSIEAAALGMWAQDVGGVRELTWRAPDVRCPIDFVHRAQDEFFTEEGARGLFDALGSEQKAFRVIAGSHAESLEQIDHAAAFLVERLQDRLRAKAPSRAED